VPAGKWSDDVFLDSLRRVGDPPADAAVRGLMTDGDRRAVGAIFALLQANDTPLPATAPRPLTDFMAASAGLPPGLETARLQRGGRAFLKNALPAVVVLLASSLPRGYAAPCLCEILTISGDLEHHPFRRLMGVVQLLVNVSDADAFQPDGQAIVTARKLRLLHAGIRAIAAQRRPHYERSFGVPVNHEDRLATIMAFSYLVVEGLHALQLDLAAPDAEDFYYLWRTFALLMGIHPEGRPHDESFIPATLAEAAEFYRSYVRRNNTLPDRNPSGVLLTQHNLDMMERMLPRFPRLPGLGWAPRVFMTELLKPEELARVGFAPLPGHGLLKACLALALRLGQLFGEREPFAAQLARLLLQGMVDVDRHGRVSFSIPFTRLDLHGSAFE
jgi:hypothetical protein